MSNEEKKNALKALGNYQIQIASLKDLDTIYHIEVLSFKDAYPKSLLWQLIHDQKAICLVIKIDQQILGFAVGLIRSSNKGHIISIAIDPRSRKHNYGSFLLTHLISEMKNRGVKLIQLEVRISNKVAINLYKKFDFQILSTKKRYYSDGEDAYLMSYRLANNTEEL